MDVMIIMFQFLAGFLGIVGFILGLLALTKVSKIESNRRKDNAQFNFWQSRLEAQLKALEQRAGKDSSAAQSEENAEIAGGIAHESDMPPAVPLSAKPTVKPPQPPPVPAAGPPAGQGTGSKPPAIPLAAKAAPEPALQKRPAPKGRKVAPQPAFDLEKWLGVRGAAVLGGIVLALAGIYLFKYAIDQGLISPAVRVALGGSSGLICLFLSGYMRKRDLHLPANAVAGGGVVILYGTIWASHGLYHQIHGLIAFAFMAMVTLVCGFLANGYRSKVIGMLGLFGGFAAPIMIYAGDLPTLGLFGYLFLLNLGLLTLSKKMAMPSMSFVSLLATGFYEAFVIFTQLEDSGMVLVQAILVVFAGLYLLWCEWMAPGDSRWIPTRLGAMLVPFFFGLYLASNPIVTLEMVPMGAMLAVLSAGACWLAYRREELNMMRGAALGAVSVLWFWVFNHIDAPGCLWLKALVPVVIAAIFCAPFFIGDAVGKPAKVQKSFGLIGWLVVLATFIWTLTTALFTSPHNLLPWLMAWLILAGLLLFLGRKDTDARWNGLVGIGPAIGMGLWLDFFYDKPDFSWPVYLGAMVLVSIGLTQIHPLFLGPKARNDAEKGVALFPVLLLLAFAIPFQLPMDVGGKVMLTLFLAFIGVWVAARNANGLIYNAAIFATMVCQWSQITYGAKDELGWLPLLGPVLTAAFFSFFPFFSKLPFRNRKWVWYGSAFAPVVWFPSLYVTYHRMFGNNNVALLALGLGAMSLVAAWLCQQGSQEDVTARKTGLIWFAAVALGFVTMAIPLELKRAWLTVSWALEGTVLLVLWIKWKHPGLKYTAIGLFGAVVFRLVLNPFVLQYDPGSDGRIFNWLMYTYLIPVGAMLAGCKLLKNWEQKLAHAREAFLYRRKQPVFCYALGFSAILVVFVYLNLAVFKFYSSSGPLEITLVRHPARDLTLSLVWAGYGLSLMALGIRRKFTALRRLSLGLVILTLSKVFLYDLGELTDLYRVASLFGLAVSLLAVSIIYQKFVTLEDRGSGPAHSPPLEERQEMGKEPPDGNS